MPTSGQISMALPRERPPAFLCTRSQTNSHRRRAESARCTLKEHLPPPSQAPRRALRSLRCLIIVKEDETSWTWLSRPLIRAMSSFSSLPLRKNEIASFLAGAAVVKWPACKRPLEGSPESLLYFGTVEGTPAAFLVGSARLLESGESMAEARAAVDNIRVVGSLQLEAISTRAKLRGPQIHGVDGGLVLVVPSPAHLVRIASRKLFGLYNHFLTACWPAPVWLVMATITFLVGYVVKDDGDSWLRSGPVASKIWELDERFVGLLGLSTFLPLYFRIAYLAAWCSLALMLVVALMQRLFMRTLLNYRGWMYEKKPSVLTLIWGGILRAFFYGQRSPLTFSFQSAMPRLPVPPLKETMKRYLRTVKPLLSDDEYARTEKDAKEFMSSGGAKKCQAILVMKSWLTGNYVSDWWEKYVYLRSRSPILINSNYYGLGYAYHIPSSQQTARSAVLVHFYAQFKNMLDSERLTPTLVRGAVPICMRQYERLFCLTREPGRDTDILRHHDSVHIAVQYKGTWWKVDCYSVDKRPLPAGHLKQQFDFIVRAVGSMVVAPAPSSPEANLPALTALNRTRWAEIREDYFLRDGINKLSLEELESAMFVLHLDDRSTGKLSDPADWTRAGNLSLHGEGNTRWCDKSFNLCVYANGDAAVHAEHSWADAPVIAHAWEWVLCKEVLTEPYTAEGKLKDESGCATLEKPLRLEWQLWGKVGEAVMEAAKCAKDLCDDLDLVVDCHDANSGGYGKGFCKKQRCGPDAWIQVALQVAYKRDQEELPLTYEAAAVRMFNEGRTETIRSVSIESKEFVDLLDDPAATKEDKVKALRAACDHHQATSRDAGIGKGVDRHLFGLYVAGQAIGSDVKFIKEALSIPFKLSTSQIPQRQTTERPDGDPKLLSPSGGFGPVSDSGYGVSYMMADDLRTFFHVSSKKSCEKTKSDRFMGQIKKALTDMKNLFTPDGQEIAKVEKTTAS